MKTFAFVPLLIFLGLFNLCRAQILEQDFDELESIEEFQSPNPDGGQVNKMDLRSFTPGTGKIPFILESDGDGKHLLIQKEGRRYRHFIKHSGFDNLASLVVRFQLTFQSASGEAQFGGMYLGNALEERSFYPVRAHRWAQIGIHIKSVNGKKGFFIRNELPKIDDTSPAPFNGETVFFTDEQTITIIANNSGGLLTYNGPDNKLAEIKDKTVDIWVGDNHEIKSAPAFLGNNSNLSEFKFLTWGNDINASAWLDNLYINEINNTSLPVILTAFSAKKSGTDVILDWETASENNSSHFEVERSLDGQQFLKIGKVPAAGNSHTPIDYSFIDLQASLKFAGIIYYRLHQVDIDGTSEYSPIRSVELSAPHTAIRRVYPNPFVEELKVSLLIEKSIKINFRLVNMQGNTVVEEMKTMEPAGEEQIFQFTGSDRLAAGMYFLEITSAVEKSLFKVIKY